MKKPIGYYWYVIKQFLRNPLKFIRSRREEKILNTGANKLEAINDDRYKLRMEMMEWLKKKKATGKLNDHHATALISKHFNNQLEEAGVIASAHGYQVVFRKVRHLKAV
tara:strand:- start:666 stop:992 length:327 start_codon:yes stop_codon:yes gene_type:complete